MSAVTSPPAKAPKTMSSKLLTMKFMQRAAASSPVSSPSTPDIPSSKRQKTDHSSSPIFDVESLADQRAVQAALATEEAKRQAALERQAADAGDTRWILEFKGDVKNSNPRVKSALIVVSTGFASIDNISPKEPYISHDEVSNSYLSTTVGRRSYGKFNRTIEKLQDPMAEDYSDSESDEDEGEDEDDDQSDDASRNPKSDNANATIDLIKAARDEAAKKVKEDRKSRRPARRAKESVERVKTLRSAENAENDIKLNHLTSISGGNRQTNQACHRCGEVGHLKADCPNPAKPSNGNERKRPKKSRRSK